MGLNLDEKKALVAEVGAKVAQAQAMVLAEYRSLEVAHITQLRAKARGAGVYLRVLRNTLVRRAVAQTPFAGLAEHMSGPLMYGISSDPVAVAKVLHEFAKANDKLVIKAGAMPNQVMTSKEVATLASHAQPRAAAGQADGNHAGPGGQAGTHAQRGTGQVCAYPRGGAGRQREGCVAVERCVRHILRVQEQTDNGNNGKS